jgi:hypothetical protein
MQPLATSLRSICLEKEATNTVASMQSALSGWTLWTNVDNYSMSLSVYWKVDHGFKPSWGELSLTASILNNGYLLINSLLGLQQIGMGPGRYN